MSTRQSRQPNPCRATPAALLLYLGLCVAAHAQVPASPASPAPVVFLEYDANGNFTKATKAGLSTSHQYDSLNRRWKTTDASARDSLFGYAGVEDLASVTDPRGLVTRYPRNGLGDATGLVSPDTGAESYTLNAAGNLLTRTDARGVLATYSYDALNRLKSIIYSQPGQATQSFIWNYDQTGPGFSFGIGRLTSTQFPAGAATYAYDAQGRLVSTSQTVVTDVGSVSLSTAYGYDAAGHIISIVYPSGRVLYIPHTAGLPTGMSVAASGSAAVPLISDLQFQPGLGMPASPLAWNWQLLGGAQAHVRGFDTYGRMVRYPIGGAVRDLSYDAADRIIGYTHWDAFSGNAITALNQTFAYDEVGRLTRVTTGAGTWALSYDGNGNRTQLDIMAGGVSTSSVHSIDAASNRLLGLTAPARSFDHDAAGNVTQSVESGTGWTAQIDLSGRIAGIQGLSAASSGAKPAAGQYAYGPQGQRVAKLQLATSPPTPSPNPGPGRCLSGLLPGRPCTPWPGPSPWDNAAQGSGTAMGSLNASGSTEASNAGAGTAAIGTASNWQGTVFVYGQQGELLGEYDAATGSVLREYVWLQDLPLAVIDGTPASPVIYYVYADHLNTPRVLIDRSGRQRWSWVAEPFGNSAPIENPLGFGAVTLNLRMPGQYFDAESGLSYNWMRAYDARVGRYTQSDPIGLAGGINTYAYVGGNPISYVDPMGLDPFDVQFNRGAGTIWITPPGSASAQGFAAANNATSTSRGPWAPGTYSFAYSTTHRDDAPGSPYGSNGNAVFKVPGCDGCGVHSGREGKRDLRDRWGVQHATEGCIRTTDDATKLLQDLIRQGHTPTLIVLP